MYTDNNPLTYVLTSAKLEATGHRWMTYLASYDFKILYRSGKYNTNADALSCLPENRVDEQPSIDAESIKAISVACQVPNYVECLSMLADVVSED